MRILWIKTELLHPVDKGGRIRTHAMLRELKREHHVTYLCLDDGTAAGDAVARADEYCHELVRVPFRAPAKRSARFYLDLARNLGSALPYAIARYRSREMREAIAEHVRRERVDVLVCDFLAPSLNVPEGLPCATVLFQHNVEATIWQRHHEVATGRLKRAFLRAQWRRMREFERRECARYDHVVAVSPEDARAMERDYGVGAVSAVPTGVDTAYFTPAGASPRPDHLVFTGSMDWLPNEDAIRHFATEVLPRIRAAVPGVSLAVVGRDPTPALRALAAADPSITLSGRVPDVRPYIEQAAVYVVPLRIGGGTRLKIYEAMAMERPVVSTSVGAEGLPLSDGRDLLLADTPEAFAAAVVRLLRDPALAREVAATGAARVRARYGWSQVAASFASICERAARHGGSPRPAAHPRPEPGEGPARQRSLLPTSIS